MLDLIYAILFAVAVVSAGVVVLSRQAIYCALALVVTMLSLAGIFLVIQAPFVALIQILVYAGAVMVLFLYVIMLLNPRLLERIAPIAIARRVWAVFAVAVFFFMAIAWGLRAFAAVSRDVALEGVGVKQLAAIMLTDYLLPFELTSVLLLVAIIGAVLIAGRSRPE